MAIVWPWVFGVLLRLVARHNVRLANVEVHSSCQRHCLLHPLGLEGQYIANLHRKGKPEQSMMGHRANVRPPVQLMKQRAANNKHSMVPVLFSERSQHQHVTSGHNLGAVQIRL